MAEMVAWREFGVLEEAVPGYSHGASGDPMRPGHGGFMLPVVRPFAHSILISINTPSFADRMFLVRLKRLIGFNTGRCSSHAEPRVFRPYLRYTFGRQ
jgi:hypothetical protein